MVDQMASISSYNSPLRIHPVHRNLISFQLSTSLSVASSPCRRPLLCALKARYDSGRLGNSGGKDAYSSDLLRREPRISPEVKDSDESSDEDYENKRGNEEVVIDWEDQILEDTVPLVGFVRMILHSGKYSSGDRLSPEHERTIIERLLRYHPQCKRKIGCGIDYITIGYHPDFITSKCLFIVRKDGELVDFSYWKCIKGFIRNNYPLHADNFILRHFRWRQRGG